MPNRKYTDGELLNANEAAINHPAQLLAFDARNDVPALCIAITDQGEGKEKGEEEEEDKTRASSPLGREQIPRRIK